MGDSLHFLCQSDARKKSSDHSARKKRQRKAQETIRGWVPVAIVKLATSMMFPFPQFVSKLRRLANFLMLLGRQFFGFKLQVSHDPPNPNLETSYVCPNHHRLLFVFMVCVFSNDPMKPWFSFNFGLCLCKAKYFELDSHL